MVAHFSSSYKMFDFEALLRSMGDGFAFCHRQNHCRTCESIGPTSTINYQIQVKVSVNLLLFLPKLHLTTRKAHRDLLAALKQRGADGVEVPIFKGNPDHYAKVGKIVTGTFGDECTTAVSMVDVKADPSSPSKRVRERALRQLKHRIDCAKALGAKALVGPLTSPWATWPTRNCKQLSGDKLVAEMETRLRFAVDVLGDAAIYAAGLGMELCTEYLNPWELPAVNTIGQARDFAAQVNMSTFGVLTDTAHEAAGGGLEMYDRMVRCILGKYPLHVHISAPYHRGDIVQSSIDWQILSVLRSLGWKGHLVVELFNAVEPFASGARLNRKSWSDESCLFMAERAVCTAKEQWERASSDSRLHREEESPE